MDFGMIFFGFIVGFSFQFLALLIVSKEVELFFQKIFEVKNENNKS